MPRIGFSALAGLFIVAIGLLLIAQGGRMMAASLFASQARQVKSEIYAEHPVKAREIETAVYGLHLAEQWWPKPQYASDRALLELTQLERQRLSGLAAAEALARARRDLDDALSREPLNPYGWVRLAYIFTLSPGPSAASAKALERSFLTGPLDRQLILTRYELSLANWHVLPPSVRAMLEHELKLTWQGYVYQSHARSPYKRRMIASALAYNRIDWLRGLVVNSAEDAFHFNAMLAQERARANVEIKIDADSEDVQP